MKNFAHKHSSARSSLGFTLVELLVGISLGVIVLGGVMSVYIPTMKSWSATASLAQIHDTESVLHDVFGTSIRQAGLLACGRNFNIIDGTGLSSADRADSINWAFKSSDFLVTSFLAFAADVSVQTTLGMEIQSNRLTNQITSGSTYIGDAFYVLAPSRGFYRVDAHDASTANKTITLSSRLSKNISFKSGDFFIVNDCNNPMLIRASTDTQSTYDAGTNKATIDLKYTNTQSANIVHPVNTVINVFEPAIYYLRAQSGVPTLYKATISATTPLSLRHTPLLTGVENLRIEYGIADGSGKFIEKYETVNGPSGAGNSANASLSNVLSVRISVMIQAPSGDSTQSDISFPNLKGDLLYCFRDGESAKEGFEDACPEFLDPAIGGRKKHKVIQFTYILPRIISI
jgi:type IV pilus assembly protein PilW